MEKTVEVPDAQQVSPKGKPERKDSISTLWTDFTQGTGFHGVNNLTPGGRYKFRCFWWIFVIMGMTVYMTYNISKEVINFYTYPTVTSVKVELVEELDFPAVTICSHVPYSLFKLIVADPELETYMKEHGIYGYRGNSINWTAQFLSTTFHQRQSREWWLDKSLDFSTLFRLCSMLGSNMSSCSQLMTPVITKYGPCHTFNFNVSDIWKVKLVGDENNLIVFGDLWLDQYFINRRTPFGMRVILHEPNTHPDTVTSSFLVSPGASTYAAVKRSTFKYLPVPHKAFPNGFCINTDASDFKNPLVYFNTYTYGHCMLECEIKHVYGICNCTKVQDIGPREPVCSIYELVTCYDYHIERIRKDSNFTKSCGCEMECTFSTFETKLSTSKYPSAVSADLLQYLFFHTEEMLSKFLEIRIYYEKLTVRSTEQLPKYNTESLIGSIGGHMGFCLGASILTMTELGEFFVFLCVNLLKRNRD